MNVNIDRMRRRLITGLALALPTAFLPAAILNSRSEAKGSAEAELTEAQISAILVGVMYHRAIGRHADETAYATDPDILSFPAVKHVDYAPIRRELVKKCADDFAAGRTIKVGGAWLALSEVEVCARLASSIRL